MPSEDRSGEGSWTEGPFRALLKRFIQVEHREIPVMLASAGLFFCVLAGNYVIRPLRDEMGVSTGDSLSWLFVGTLLALVLIYVVNVQSFGWTIQFHFPWPFVLQSTLLILVVTAIAGLYPAARAVSRDSMRFAREE